ncbi:MAG: hypothetical protein MZU91_10045 [Desulfosudis oleivorans]|nr:hypothetical protein [Desulfosudis oleivorans]
MTEAYAQSCEKVVRDVNVRLSPKIDEQELIEIIRTLNRTNNKKLPAKFVNKQDGPDTGMEARQGSVVRERPQRFQHRRRPVSKPGGTACPIENGARRIWTIKADTEAANALSFPGR